MVAFREHDKGPLGKRVGPLATEFQKSQSLQLLFSTEVNIYSHLFLYILTAAVHTR